MNPTDAYYQSMVIIRSRLIAGETEIDNDTPLARAERIALHVRKIIEGIAFASLSSVEVRNKQSFERVRTKDAVDILRWLNKKCLLKLPSAQRLGASVPGYRMVLDGGAGTAQGLDLSLQELERMYSRSSSLIHERHPERLSPDEIAKELATIQNNLQQLKQWLWLHVMFLRGDGFLIQMGKHGTDSFMVNITRASS